MGRSSCVRPAVSKIITSDPFRLAAFNALFVISIGCCFSTIGKFKILFCSASSLSCSCAAGRYTSRLTNITFFLKFFSINFANLAAEVVFPDPCNPTKSIETGGTAFKFNSSFLAPRILTSSS